MIRAALAASAAAGALLTGLCAAPAREAATAQEFADSHGAVDLEIVGQLDGRVSCVHLHDTAAYLGVGFELHVVDVRNPYRPVPIAETGVLPDVVRGVDASESHAYVAAGRAGLLVFSIAEPAAPRQVGALTTSGAAMGVFVTGNLAYVAGGDAGLLVIDITDPTTPREIVAIDTPGSSTAVRVDGALAYVADETGGLRIVDVSEPSAPHEVGVLSEYDAAHDLQVVGTLVYLAAGSSGLRIIDVSDSSEPAEIGASSSGNTQGVHVSGGLAYTGTNDWSGAILRVIDVSDPTAPAELSQLGVGAGSVGGVATSGTFAYLAANAGGLRVFDVSDPVVTFEVADIYAASSTTDLHVADGKAYVAAGGGGYA